MANDDSRISSGQRQTTRDALASLAIAIWCGEVIVAVLLLSRRAAFTLPETVWPAVVVAVVGYLFSMLCCGIESFTRTTARNVISRVGVILLTAVPPFVAGLSLLPTDSGVGVSALGTLCGFAVLAAVVLQGEFSTGVSRIMPLSQGEVSDESDIEETLANEARLRPAVEFEPQLIEAEIDAGPTLHAGENVSQWMSRTISDDEMHETIEGATTAEFAAGAKTAVVHLPFAPPFAATPDLECEPADVIDVRLRTAAVHSYGARIEVRRSTGIDAAQSVEIAYAATAAVRQNRVA